MSAVVQQIFDFLSQESPFDELDSQLLTEIAQNSHVTDLTNENKEVFFQQHKRCLYLIETGQFGVTDSQGPIKHLSEGDYFGYPSLLDDVEYKLKVLVDSPGRIICISAELFRRCFQEQAFAQFFTALNSDALQNKAVSDSNSMWLYKPLFEVVQHTPITVKPNDSVQTTAQLMSNQRISSVLVMQENKLLGIVTDRDLRNRVVAMGFNTQLPVKQIMTENPAFLTKNKTIFDAICLMNEKNIHHLPIVDARTGEPFGMVTNTDISRQQRANVLFVISDLSSSKDLETLASNAWQVPQYIASTAKRAGDFDIAGKILAQATDIITRKLIMFFQQIHGNSPMAFCWLVFASQAREEQTMGSVQNNGLLLEHEPNDTQAEYFEKLSEYVCLGLAKCGIKLSDKNVMASNPKLRLSLASAKEELNNWVNYPSNDNVFDNRVFLDSRAVAGDIAIHKAMQEYRKPLLKAPKFLAALARNANAISVPLSMFQKFIYAEQREYSDCIDIKQAGVSIINNLVRIYALESGLSLPSTVHRLNNLPADCGLPGKDRANLRDIWLFLNRLRWRHQLNNNVDDNFVRVSDLSSIEKHQLKAAFQAIHKAQQDLVLSFSGGIG